MAGSCKPPKRPVKSYWRRKPRKKATASQLEAKARWIVKDSRNGRTISRHRSFTAAVNAEKKYNLATWRRGQGRPYEAVRGPAK